MSGLIDGAAVALKEGTGLDLIVQGLGGSSGLQGPTGSVIPTHALFWGTEELFCGTEALVWGT